VTSDAVFDALRSVLRPGCRVWLGDGVSIPLDACPALSAVAREVGDVHLVVGWCPVVELPLEVDAFASVRAFMGGYGLRRAIDRGSIRYVPARLGTVPSLIAGALRPDVVVVSVQRRDDGHHLTTEVAWIPAAIERPNLPVASALGPLPPETLRVGGISDAPALEYLINPPTDDHRALGANVARFVTEGVRVQFGPGQITDAAMAAIDVPVRVTTGLLSDAVLRLDQRGLLLGTPSAPYLAGSSALYEWADGRPLLHRLEDTHDPGALSIADPPLVAINTALEIDHVGQVNVERRGGSTVGGVGGQPDFAAAAARSRTGISVVALLSQRGGESTLVEQLSAPASTARHDVDVVVTERGAADLRGLDDHERRHALTHLWGA
jgi:acyl-CoA hydrolase